jgi:hypothetical protein
LDFLRARISAIDLDVDLLHLDAIGLNYALSLKLCLFVRFHFILNPYRRPNSNHDLSSERVGALDLDVDLLHLSTMSVWIDTKKQQR